MAGALAMLGFAPLPGPTPLETPSPGSETATPRIRVIARARESRFEIAIPGEPDRYRPLFLKGVNMGVALPGRFPSEFPEDPNDYRRWLALVSELGANCVRLYTLLPPAFYTAFAQHNAANAGHPIWLVQGVWTELPERDAYDDPAFLGEFQAEIRRVIDAVHGHAAIAPRPGHAGGSYSADVSAWTIGYLLGREWEPYSVEAYDSKGGKLAEGANAANAAGKAPSVSGTSGLGEARHASRDIGRYIAATAEATPFERWLGARLDFLVAYETERYHQQRPVSFVNWPTLDPLVHPTEATVAEERELLQVAGRARDHAINEYDNDGVSVDASHLTATAEAQGGLFATYHAYPYYPDFMNLDPGYAKARDSIGPSRYIGYLRELARHHGTLPILIAETGVPTSRGIAHLQADGWHHGGHTEAEQGAIDARLVRDIHEAGLSGAILFALFDEWFKRNWLVVDFELPYLRKPLWLNILDPEENYGLLATRPGASGWKITIDGRGQDWSTVTPLMTADGVMTGGPRQGVGEAPERRAPPSTKPAPPPAKPVRPERSFDDGHDAARTLRALRATSDEAYLYLRLDIDALDADGDGSADWNEVSYVIGIDTYDAARGDHRLPVEGSAAGPIGWEFAIVIDGPGTTRLLVDPPYDIETHRYHRPFHSERNEDGRFMPMTVETNRMRVGRDGTVYPPRSIDRSTLRRGSMISADPDYDTLAEWRESVSERFIELRIGWGLLNVTDPSSRRVLHDDTPPKDAIGTLVTPGFRFYAAAIKPQAPADGAKLTAGIIAQPAAGPGAAPIAGTIADRLPHGDAPRADAFPLFVWRGWDRPTYRIEKKDSFALVAAAFAALEPR